MRSTFFRSTTACSDIGFANIPEGRKVLRDGDRTDTRTDIALSEYEGGQLTEQDGDGANEGSGKSEAGQR